MIMNKDWCFEPLKKYGGFIQTEQEYKEVMKIVEENLHKDKNEDKLITIHKTLLEEKDKEIERLRKREKKWEKWTTEKEILSTKMSEYLCKWKNIKREYKNQVESNRLKKQKIERLNKELEGKDILIKMKTERIQNLMNRLAKRQDKVDRLNNIIDELDNKLCSTWQLYYDHSRLTTFKCEDMLYLIEQIRKDIEKLKEGKE